MSVQIDVLLISASEAECGAIKEICTEFGYTLEILPSFEKALEASPDAKIAIISDSALPKEVSVTEAAQGMKQVLPQSYQISLLENELPKEKSTFLRKSGSDMIALRSELLGSSKFWFAISQTLRATYLPLKSIDIVENVPVPFVIYHLLPERKKFVPFVFSGDLVPPDKLEKIKKMSEYYFHRLDAQSYQGFVDKTSDKTAQGYAKRCRAVYLALQAEFTILVLAISDQSDIASVGEGQALIGRCRKLCEDLLQTLGEFPKAWEIINSSAIGDFGSLERAPAVSAYCGLFSIFMNLPEITSIMISALFCDFAYMRLSPELTKKLRTNRSLTKEIEKEIQKVPEMSLDMILSRKLSVDKKERQLITTNYERADGSGVPNKFEKEKIPMGAQLIRFARDFDRETLLRIGEPRKNPLKVLHEMVNKEEPGVTYSNEFLMRLKEKVLVDKIFQEESTG